MQTQGGRREEREATIQLPSGPAHTPASPGPLHSPTVSPPRGIFWPQGGVPGTLRGRSSCELPGILPSLLSAMKKHRAEGPPHSLWAVPVALGLSHPSAQPAHNRTLCWRFSSSCHSSTPPRCFLGSPSKQTACSQILGSGAVFGGIPTRPAASLLSLYVPRLLKTPGKSYSSSSRIHLHRVK